MRVLSERYNKKLIAKLGHSPLNKDEFMSVPEIDLLRFELSD
jgi:hypothetical protein